MAAAGSGRGEVLVLTSGSPWPCSWSQSKHWHLRVGGQPSQSADKRSVTAALRPSRGGSRHPQAGGLRGDVVCGPRRPLASTHPAGSRRRVGWGLRRACRTTVPAAVPRRQKSEQRAAAGGARGNARPMLAELNGCRLRGRPGRDGRGAGRCQELRKGLQGICP